MRPRGMAFRMPGHLIATRSVGERPVAYRSHALVKPVLSSRACGPRPSAEWASDARKALRGKPRDNVEVGFLGGTHSVRPRCKAGGKPRHNIIIGGKRAPGGPMGRSPGGGEASFAGVRSPPLVSYA